MCVYFIYVIYFRTILTKYDITHYARLCSHLRTLLHTSLVICTRQVRSDRNSDRPIYLLSPCTGDEYTLRNERQLRDVRLFFYPFSCTWICIITKPFFGDYFFMAKGRPSLSFWVVVVIDRYAARSPAANTNTRKKKGRFTLVALGPMPTSRVVVVVVAPGVPSSAVRKFNRGLRDQ